MQSREQATQRLREIGLAGLNSYHFLNAAHSLGVPTRPMLLDTFMFGHGVHQRSMQSTVTDRTSFLGVQIAHSKARTSQVLRLHGLPCPAHAIAASEAQSVEVAASLGYPVVVKPDDEEQGRGVEAGLRDEESVIAAYRAAGELSKTVLVEKHHEGQDYRLTVFKDEVVKILLRTPSGVTGDGVHTIAELVGILQQTPRYQDTMRYSGKWLLSLDSEALRTLAAKGGAVDDVPAAGQFVALRRKCNISAGGIQTLVAVSDAHPDNLALAVRATRAVGLDIAGVDVLMEDLATSWLETGAVIIEVNARPQIGIKALPEAYPKVLSGLMGGNGRIPVHLVLCATEADRPSEREAVDFAATRQCNGLSTVNGFWVEGQPVTNQPMGGFEAAEALLMHDAVTGACCVMTAQEVAANGLPTDRYDSVIVRDGQAPAGDAKNDLPMALAMLGVLRA